MRVVPMQMPVRRPMVGMAVFFIAGILLAEYCAIPAAWVWGAAAAFALCATMSLLMVELPWLANVCIFALVAAVGVLCQQSTTRTLPPNDIRFAAQATSSFAKLRGVITSPPESERLEPVLPDPSKDSDPDIRTTFDVRATAICIGSEWRNVTGLVRVRIYEKATDLRYGDEIEFSGGLKRPPPQTNPGQFDYARFLARQGIFAVASVGSRENVQRLSAGHGSWVKRRLFAVRRAAQAVFDRFAGPQTGSILSCMLLGHRQAVHGRLAEAFVRSGTAHVLAISGLHLMILAGTLWRVLCLTPLDRRLNAVLLLIFIGFFVGLTGMRAPVVRAGVIAGMMCIGEILSKRSDTLNSLGAAAVLILLGNPNEIFSAGFQLTFTAVLGIVCFAWPMGSFIFGQPTAIDRLAVEDERSVAREWLGPYARTNSAVSCATMLTTAPLVAWHFHIFAPIAIFVNLLVFPFLWIIISLGALEILAGMIYLPLAWPLAQCVNGTTYLFAKMVLLAEKIRFGYAYLPGPSDIWLIGCYGILLIAACRSLLPVKRVYVWAMMAGLFILPSALRAVSTPPDELRVTCLDVGRGAAFVVEFPNGRNLLYDAGTARRYDVGRSVVAPFLWSRGIRKVDALVISHAHADHFSGVPAMCERFPVKSVFINRRFAEQPTPAWVIDWLRLHKAGVEIVAAGDRIAGYGECSVEVLHPPDGPILDMLAPNDQSCALRIRWRDFCLLLTGDLEDQGVCMVRRNFPGLRADAMQVPHHGRLSAAIRDFVEGCSPKAALVNTDETDLSPAVRQLASRGIEVYATPEAGAVTLRLDRGGNVRVEAFCSCKSSVDAMRPKKIP
ncbi:MAG: DNA internalization-related competence protein ComEC/Rec2 [Planctomycetota bacterium]